MQESENVMKYLSYLNTFSNIIGQDIYRFVILTSIGSIAVEKQAKQMQNFIMEIILLKRLCEVGGKETI